MRKITEKFRLSCLRNLGDHIKKGNIPWNKGKPWDAATKQKMRIAKLGKHLTTEHKLHLSMSQKGIINSGRFLKGRLGRRGSESHFWKGGITSARLKIHNTLEYKTWRIAVFERDNYRCLDCGELGGRLNADHIFPFALYPRLRFMLENGRTLCLVCHQRTSTFGGRTTALGLKLCKTNTLV